MKNQFQNNPIQTEHKLPIFLNRVVGRYIKAFAPEGIILFGSYAKGTNHSGSDIDILVVANPHGSVDLNLSRARQLASDCFPHVDVVFATPEEVASANSTNSPFLSSILEKGITLYSRT